MNAVTSLRRRDGTESFDDAASSAKPPDAGALERAGRAAAQARLDRLAAVGDGSIDGGENGDEDLCGSGRAPRTVLYWAKPGESNAVAGQGAVQGSLNDCHLMAPLAAIASTPAGRALIEKAIVENRNDAGVVLSYTVTLHESVTHLFGPRTFEEVKLTFDPRFAKGHAQARCDDDGRVAEVWALVVEKAYAQMRGGYHLIDAAGSPRRALEALTGRPAFEIRLDAAPSYTARDLVADIEADKPVVLLTQRSMRRDGPYGLVPDHCYQVAGYEVSGDRVFVKLHNPWNKAEPREVPFDELRDWFQAIDVGAVK
jgi:hypothetical protein